jgi:molybdopterin/thiamine biosynthesis adenylyltransferase
MKIHIIGAGGVGSWLTPSLCLLTEPESVTVYDGDKLEFKNLNRQLFSAADVGAFKSTALASKYGCGFYEGYYSHGLVDIDDGDWLIGCVDNHAARKSILESCDAYGAKAIFGANEVTSAEAFYYEPKWAGTPADPRVYIPEILTDHSDDPRAASIGCTGEAQRANRQLVSANFMAAALIQHLFVIWQLERRKFDKETLGHLPFRIQQNLTKYETTKPKDTHD